MINILNLVDKIKITDNIIFDCYRDITCNEYIVRGYLYNTQIYGKRFQIDEFNAYRNYLKARVEYAFEHNIFGFDYTMIEVGKRMYKRVNKNIHFRSFNQVLIPADFTLEDDYLHFDLITDCSLKDGIIYPDDALVFKYGSFYHMGNKLKDLDDVLENVIQTEEENVFDLTEDLLEYEIPSCVLKYLTWDYYSPDFKQYITDKVSIDIDKWY